MPSGLDALEQMGVTSFLGCIPHRPLDAWEFLLNDRLLFRVHEPLEPGGKPCTLVSQSALLKVLTYEASTNPNFEFIQGAAVQDLLWSGNRISGVKLGNDRRLEADLVIGADGRNSIVRQRANLPLEQESQRFDVLWFKLADSPRFEAENVFYSILRGRHGFGLFRGSEGNLQVGWLLRQDVPIDWKQTDWPEMLASTSPPWLAEHFRTHAATIERPVLLSVVVGHCPHWWAPGLLLLGDAAHPMSPIRAQGINVALRDVIVAANYLVPLLRQGSDHAAVDAALSQIQAQREPEIMRVQQLQSQEAAKAERLGNSALLRWSVSQLAPLLRQPIQQVWLRQQRQLRQGVSQLQLTV